MANENTKKKLINYGSLETVVTAIKTYVDDKSSTTDTKVGDLATLTTDAKGTVVAALNEIDANANTAKTSADSAQTDATSALTKIGDATSGLTKDIADINTKIGDTSYTGGSLTGAIAALQTAASAHLTYEVVEALPTADIDTKKIYLLKDNAATGTNVYTENLYVNGDWEVIGTTASTFNDYAKTVNGKSVNNNSVTITGSDIAVSDTLATTLAAKITALESADSENKSAATAAANLAKNVAVTYTDGTLSFKSAAAETATKLVSVAEGAQVNVIETIKTKTSATGEAAALTIADKTVTIDLTGIEANAAAASAAQADVDALETYVGTASVANTAPEGEASNAKAATGLTAKVEKNATDIAAINELIGGTTGDGIGARVTSLESTVVKSVAVNGVDASFASNKATVTIDASKINVDDTVAEKDKQTVKAAIAANAAAASDAATSVTTLSNTTVSSTDTDGAITVALAGKVGAPTVDVTVAMADATDINVLTAMFAVTSKTTE